ncbi:MAG TPA: MBL fold metallo-hydrolase [Acidimicrobiia bacterium]|jgi:glyoxylase-like metal-dependent hydrolase (beta-lactamase superfamily II)|nr:MBL fold metallo-hydrolase [Acidimicrobiia bacterium]
MERWTVGDSVITRVPDEHFELVVPQDDATTSVLRSQASWLAPRFLTDAFELRLGSSALAVDTPGARIVVDPWLVFDDADRTTPDAVARIDRLLTGLTDAGFPPESVDVVVNTHIDGVGANTRPVENGEVPAFPNARYVIASEEIAALREGRFPGAEALDVLLADELVDHPAGRVAGDVVMEPGAGHSPGHHVVRIGSEGDDALVIGHLFLHPAQVFSPGPRAGLDAEIEVAAETRRALLRRAAEEKTLVIGPLWATPGAGTIVPADEPGRWRLEPAA